ncbi:MAG: glycosyltransferase [Wenzhouxiangellaceae bacterium]|nr:glycosyltransferase [Wenzhouxiangellaceae bacterium]
MPALSVVVPVAPGDSAWRGLVDVLAGLSADCECIFSGSGPRPEQGLPAAARWVRGKPGRALQLNRGVRAAAAPMLWLLHADSRPDARVLARVQDGLTAERAQTRIAYFDLAFVDGPRAVALNAWGARLRSRLFALPYGDQGWLLPRAVFEQLGGFDATFGRGEDLDFIVRARAAGVSIEALGVPLVTSARRYREQGWWATTREHLRLTLELRRKALNRIENK